MQAIGERAFCFAGYTLDPIRGCVRAGSRDVALRPKSFAVLVYLVANAGRLVAKDELIRSVWADLNVADELVARCVSDIRQALGDVDQRLIKTVTKRGYMFVAPVSRQDEEIPASRSTIRNPFEDELETAFLERLSRGILRFRDAVAVEDEQLSRFEDDFGRAVLRVLEEPERDARSVEPFEAAVAPADERRVCPALTYVSRPLAGS